MHEQLFRLRDLGDTSSLENRTIGVQVVILDGEGRVWLHIDPDGQRIEGHVLDDGVVFPNSRPARINAVSGGEKHGETVLQTALREMQNELRGVPLGQGELQIVDAPLITSYQEKDGHAFVLATAVVLYHTTQAEAVALGSIGKFWDLDTIYRRVNGPHAELFRPAFRAAIHVHALIKGGNLADDWVGQNNSLLLSAIGPHREQSNIPFHPGLYAGAFEQREMLWQ